MATGDLVTLTQALSWLNQTTDTEGLIASLVSGVSTQIQYYIGYQVGSAIYTRTFNGIGSEKILLPDRPVVSVSALTIDGISIPFAIPPTPGFLYCTKFLYLYGGARFSRGIQNVTATYSAGFATVPQDLQMACLYWLGAAYAMIGDDPTVGSYRAGDTQTDSKNVMTTLGKTTELMPPQVLALVLPYRRVAT